MIKDSAKVACAECHQEHQGKSRLLQVADAHCVTCHSDLEAVAREDTIPRLSAENAISLFTDPKPKSKVHPRFDLEWLTEGKDELRKR